MNPALPGSSQTGSTSEIEAPGVLAQRGKIRLARLSGDPREIGESHAKLLREQMIANERVLWELLETHVPNRLARRLLLGLARFRYRRLSASFSAARRSESAAMAQALDPDPFVREMPTFERLCFLAALYDIALSFENSPLVGCTTFAIQGEARSETGGVGQGALLARAFDFEAHPIFDEEKVVFLVFEQGKIPYASVAWPGLVGVVSGMNAAGLAVVVHGARAGKPARMGEPVVHALRRVLESAETVAQAVDVLEAQAPLISHIVVVADARGNTACLERTPGQRVHVRALAPRAVVTNHFEGPAALDPRNRRIRATTSTLERFERGTELLANATGVDALSAVGWLRDRRAVGGSPLPAGDRRAIDAGIATHGVVFETAERLLWVSEGPHLSGRFLELDLKELLAPGPARATADFRVISADQAIADQAIGDQAIGDQAIVG